MKRYALCIGNNDYSILDKLKDAVSDAQAVADKLKVDYLRYKNEVIH